MESDYTKPVNVGNPDEYTIDKFATKVQQTVVDQLGPDYTSHVVYQANSRTLNDPQVKLGLWKYPKVSVLPYNLQAK